MLFSMGEGQGEGQQLLRRLAAPHPDPLPAKAGRGETSYSSCTQRISPPEPTGEKRKPLTRSVTPRISTVL